MPHAATSKHVVCWQDCCGRYHSGAEIAPTAEATMRARYSAYAKGIVDYVVDTFHPDHPQFGGTPNPNRPSKASTLVEVGGRQLLLNLGLRSCKSVTELGPARW